MVSEVLPDVPYLQIVFTIPKMLRKHFLFDRTLYGELSRVAYMPPHVNSSPLSFRRSKGRYRA